MAITRQSRRMILRQLESQIEQERNGAPTPPEIAAHMTQETEAQPLCQIWVERTNGKPPVAFGPKMMKDACELLVIAINQQIALGRERLIANPTIRPA